MTQQEVIKTFNQSLDNTNLSGRAALDEAIAASSKFANYEAVRQKFLADMKAAPDWHTFLVEKCGIILDNADTGAISGADAGGSEKTATTILPATGKAKYPTGSSFTVNGLTIYGIPDKNKLTADQQYVVRGLYSWWIKDSLALIKESYGYSFTAADTTNSRMKLKFIDDKNINTLAYVSFESDDGKSCESRVLCVNMAYFKNVKTSDRHGTTDRFNLDRTLVHELVHGLMASNVNYFADLPIFLAEGGSAELIHGLDDERRANIIKYAKDPSVFGKILSPTFTDSIREVYAGGYIFMRYFAKQAATTTFDYDTYRKTISTGSSGGFAVNYCKTVTMKGGAGSDTIANSGSNVVISTGAADDVVWNYSESVTINAGTGNDLVTNEGSQVSIVGGKGSDTISTDGAKVFVDGGSGNDILTNAINTIETVAGLTVENISAGVKSANDAVALIAAGNAALSAYTIKLVGGNNSTLRGGAGNDALNNYANNAKLYGDAGIDDIKNCGYKSTVYGGAGGDYIFNGDGTIAVAVAGFDTNATVSLSGDDSKLYGGDGSDTIENASYRVKIYGESGADSVSNTGTFSSVYGGADNDSVFNEGANSYISLGDGNDDFENYADAVKASGGAGADYFYNDGEDSTLLGGMGNDEFVNYGDYNYLSGGAGNDTIYSSGTCAILNGGDGKDYLYNEGVSVSIVGGSGNDSIHNEGNRITIAGGVGNDSIVNSGGKHIVYQFAAGDGKDSIAGFNTTSTLKVTGGYYSTVKSGSNVVVTVGDGKVTLQGAAKLSAVNISGSKGLRVTNSTKSPVTADSTTKVIDASTRTKAVRITGNKLANSIIGGSGNDTLAGGKGNDSLWGGGGSDTFIYSSGKDVIYGFDSGDLLQITDAFSAPTYNASKKSIAFKVGTGSVTLKDFGATTTFHVNDTTYRLRNGKLT